MIEQKDIYFSCVICNNISKKNIFVQLNFNAMNKVSEPSGYFLWFFMIKTFLLWNNNPY